MVVKDTVVSDWLLDGIDPVAVAMEASDEHVSTYAWDGDYWVYDASVAYYNTGTYTVSYNDGYWEYSAGYSNAYTIYNNAYQEYSNYYNYSNYTNYSNTVSVNSQPSAQIVNIGSTASFTFSISGASSPSYQWYVSSSSTSAGSAISGANSATYSFTPTVADSGKYYYCIVTAGGASTTSNRAMLTVNIPAPTITSQPSGVNIDEGGSATFSITASGYNVTYQWQYKSPNGDWSNITGSTTSNLVYNNLDLTYDEYKYRCVVSTSGGSVTSNEAILTINSIRAYSVGVSLDWSTNILNAVTPSSAVVSSFQIDSTNIADVATDGTIIGKSVGETTCVVATSTGLTKTVNVRVFDDKMNAVFYNIAVAIRAHTGIIEEMIPARMDNALNGIAGNKSYDDLGQIFSDIASSVRAIKDISGTILPEELHKKLLGIS